MTDERHPGLALREFLTSVHVGDCLRDSGLTDTDSAALRTRLVE